MLQAERNDQISRLPELPVGNRILPGADVQGGAPLLGRMGGATERSLHVLLHILLLPILLKPPPSDAKVARGSPGGTLDPTEGVFVDSQVSMWIGLLGNASQWESAQCTNAVYAAQSPKKWVETY